MGSASREALVNVAKLLSGPVAESTASELLLAASQLRLNPQLAAALTEQSPHESKFALVNRVYKEFSGGARAVLMDAASQRWSSTDEFVAGIEILGIRAAAAKTSDLEDELLAVAATVDSDNQLELTLGSKLAAPEAKAQLVEKIFATKISTVALSIVTYYVTSQTGKRLSPALREAAVLAADQTGCTLVTVTVAKPLDQDRVTRLLQALARIAGRPVKLNTVIDTNLVGGLRVQIADEIIDGSVSARLDDLRLQLAG